MFSPNAAGAAVVVPDHLHQISVVEIAQRYHVGVRANLTQERAPVQGSFAIWQLRVHEKRERFIACIASLEG